MYLQVTLSSRGKRTVFHEIKNKTAGNQTEEQNSVATGVFRELR